MFKLVAPRDLSAISALALASMLALALFGWAERTVVVDPENQAIPYWPWKLWHLGALAVAVPGVWWLWGSTRQVPWVRSLALAALSLTILLNAYSGFFGDQYFPVWRTINPLFIGCASVAAWTLWRCGGLGRLAGALSGGIGLLVAVNFYYVDNAVIWDILYPLRMVTAMGWAAGACLVNTNEVRTGRPGA